MGPGGCHPLAGCGAMGTRLATGLPPTVIATAHGLRETETAICALLRRAMSTFSFDVVSDFDRQELVNTLDQVRRDVGQRYDLKDSATEIELEEGSLTITTASDMTLEAVVDVLRQKATKRDLSLKIFDFQPAEAVGGNKVKQVVKLRKGLSQELAKQLSKTVRDELKKVTVAIQGDSLRITGKSKDDLQQAIQLLKAQDVEVPLQFENYR